MSGTIAVLPFDSENGHIQPTDGVYQQNGSSIDLESQTSSHPHCILLDKKEENAISADLGSDELLRAIQTISTLPPNFTSINYAAELLLHPVSGKFLYASNRGHDSIAVFQVDKTTGLLTIIQHINVQGRTPRNFNILPNGMHLIVANQDSDNLVVFSIDQTTGMLTKTDVSARVSKPTCIKFLIP
ncbi:unnamed protein product [Adineta steineri]|uniref:6-phosphogluconolactonase n=1 Tax=Adineta steineri TaxID=433720 RepID=A0A820H1U9_9BILA|nr:unnamed protein product [Adineta steineri]